MFSIIKWSDIKDKITHVKKYPSWQLYEKITVQEVDDAQNYSLAEIPRKVLYETNRAKSLGKKHIFLAKTKDYNSSDEINISAITKADLFEEIKQSGKLKNESPRKGYFNISAVQILVKYLGNPGKDIPVKIAITDDRCINPETSINGLISSNLYTGAFYSVLFMDLTFSAADENIDEILKIFVKTQVEMIQGSLSTAVSIKVYCSWTEEPHSFRKRDDVFNLNNVSKGQTLILKTSGQSLMEVPKPIPVEEVSWDLEFDFNKNKQTKRIASTSDVAYKLKYGDNLYVKLKAPLEPARRSVSKLEYLKRFNKNLNDVESEDSNKQ